MATTVDRDNDNTMTTWAIVIAIIAVVLIGLWAFGAFTPRTASNNGATTGTTSNMQAPSDTGNGATNNGATNGTDRGTGTLPPATTPPTQDTTPSQPTPPSGQ